MTRLAPLLILLAASVSAQTTYTWNGGSGTWNDDAKWTPSGVPVAGDTALITADGTYTVTLNADAEVENLTLGSGGTGVQMLATDAGRTLTLNGDGVIATTGHLRLTEASLDGGGAMDNAGRFEVFGSTVHTDVMNLEGGFLQILRTSALNGGLANQGFLQIQGDWPGGTDAELTVADGFTNEGTLELWGNSSGSVFGTSTLIVTSGVLINQGVIRTASNGISELAEDRHLLRAAFDNQGEIRVRRARWLEIAQADAQSLNRGLVMVEDGMILLLGDGTYTFGPASEVTGSGTLRVWDGANATFEDGVTFTARLDTRTFTPMTTILGGLTPSTAVFSTGSNGQLTFGLGGSPASGHYGHVDATGSAATGWALSLSLVDGFIPQIGDVYTLVTGNPITGSFNQNVNTPPGLAVDLAQTNSAVTVTVTAVPVAGEPESEAPMTTTLHAPRPNPVVSSASIPFDLATAGPVRLAVYDVRGREVAVLDDGFRPAGHHAVPLGERLLPAGPYLVRLTTQDQVSTRTITLLR